LAISVASTCKLPLKFAAFLIFMFYAAAVGTRVLLSFIVALSGKNDSESKAIVDIRLLPAGVMGAALW